jgi:molecular chaperone GrpE
MSSNIEEELVRETAVGAEGVTGRAEPAVGEPTDSQVEESVVVPADSAGQAALEPAAALEGEVLKWKDLALRSQAELENFRKRMAREKMDAIRYGNSALLESLMPVLDNFRFGLEAARRDGGATVVVEGMAMVYKQFNDLLEENGVQEVPAEGVRFDPNVHDAVREEPSSEVAEGHVIAVIRKGFRLHDRLLRPASVIVSSGPAAAEEGGGPQPGAAGETSSPTE